MPLKLTYLKKLALITVTLVLDYLVALVAETRYILLVVVEMTTLDSRKKSKSPAPEKGARESGLCASTFPRDQAEALVLSVHATLGDQRDRGSQNQDGAADVEDGGACDDGGR